MTNAPIVLAVDGSNNSLFAFNWLTQNLMRPGDALIVMHSYPLNFSGVGFAGPAVVDAYQSVNHKAEDQGRILLAKYAEMARNLGFECETRLYCDDPRDHIIDLAEEVGAKMVVMASRGLSKFKRVMLGSVSDYVVHNCKRPVLILRDPEHHPDWHHLSHVSSKVDMALDPTAAVAPAE
eukprot:Colp12_sorted_trinity150504_noHs@34803